MNLDVIRAMRSVAILLRRRADFWSPAKVAETLSMTFLEASCVLYLLSITPSFWISRTKKGLYFATHDNPKEANRGKTASQI